MNVRMYFVFEGTKITPKSVNLLAQSLFLRNPRFSTMSLFAHLPFLGVKLFLAAFLAILFLQSGLNKIFDYQGNKAYLADYFSRSPLRLLVGFLVPTITILEVSAGLLSAAGVVQLLWLQQDTLAWLGLLAATQCFVSLFFGQRLAQDYAGAATMTVYFLLSLFGLYVYAQ
jgi:hypothetical protein